MALANPVQWSSAVAQVTHRSLATRDARLLGHATPACLDQLKIPRNSYSFLPLRQLQVPSKAGLRREHLWHRAKLLKARGIVASARHWASRQAEGRFRCGEKGAVSGL